MMEELLKQAGDILKSKNKEGLQEIVANLLPLALENAAKASESPIDDVIVAALKKPLVDELLKLVAKI
jgi:hypothetical protein